ncbi:uncharacterized protein BN687_02080 [Clostridium sp. CAG:510]|nr:uncharacterized protein BN687_02080 [Clostridium sp. CAG:510]
MPGICGLRKGTARIMEKLLLIHSTKEIQLQVKNVASRLKLALDIIPEEYCGCHLKELAAGKYAQNPPDTVASDSTVAEGTIPSGSAATEGTVPAPAAQTPPSCLVLCGLRDKRLDKVLFELRRADIPIDYKAVLTPSNQEWTVPELMKELQRERQAMGR